MRSMREGRGTRSRAGRPDRGEGAAETNAAVRTVRKPTAVEFGIGLIAARSWPEKKIRERLSTRYEAEEVEAAIERLRELRMVDDSSWAERFTSDRLARGGKGRHRILMELQAKGIAPTVAAEAVARAVEGPAEREMAAELVARMLRRVGRSNAADAGTSTVADLPPNVRASLFRRLLARGYPASLVRELLSVDS